ncbi:hypothetical protein ABK040_009815 [Willaertia magna]
MKSLITTQSRFNKIIVKPKQFAEYHSSLFFTNNNKKYKTSFSIGNFKTSINKQEQQENKITKTTQLENVKQINSTTEEYIDTIYALASGSSSACSVSIIRISGPKALHIITEMTTLKEELTPRKAYYCTLIEPKTKTPIDKILLLYFKNPNSFTGEDVIELHCHGSKAVIQQVMKSLGSEGLGFRPADPGEFTKRAFFNQKMDLTEVEGLSDLLHAQTEHQRIQALKQLNGELSTIVTSWKDQMLHMVAHVTAFIDFGDDNGLDESVIYRERIIPQVRKLVSELNYYLEISKNRLGERLREGNGIKCALLGAPNAGKSSLLNLLAQKDVVIVSDQAGTTRDVIEVNLNLNGWPVTIADTAGIREHRTNLTDSEVIKHHQIEIEGMKRAIKRAIEADIIIIVLDASDNIVPPNEMIEFCLEKLKDDNKDILLHKKLFIVNNKIDISNQISNNIISSTNIFPISCKTKSGFDNFVNILASTVENIFTGRDEQFYGKDIGEQEAQHALLITRERHRKSFASTLNKLEKALESSEDIEIAAEFIRQAHSHLCEVTGEVDFEQILDIVFKEFCIGK